MHFNTYCSNISFYFYNFFFLNQQAKICQSNCSFHFAMLFVCLFLSTSMRPSETSHSKDFYSCFYLLLWGNQNQAKSYIFFLLLSITLRRLNSSHSKDFHSIFICYSEAIKIKLNHIYFPLFLSITLSWLNSTHSRVYLSIFLLFSYVILPVLHCGTRKIKDMLASYSFHFVDLVPET